MKSRKLIEAEPQKEISTHRKGGEEFWKNKYILLSQENNRLLQKQKKYLEQLQTLEGRVSKQNQESLQLQELYNQLMNKFKQKDTEVEELRLYYQPSSEAHSPQLEILQRQVEDLTECLNEQRRSRIKQREHKEEREQIKEKCLCWKYFQSGLPSVREAAGMFQELQRRINGIGQMNLRLEYENGFLKSRNKDLEVARDDLSKVLSKKQEELGRTREQYIKLIELEDATNKYLRKTNMAASSSSFGYSPPDTKELQKLKTRLSSAEEEVMILNQVVAAQREKISCLEEQLEPDGTPHRKQNPRGNNDFFSFSQQKRSFKRRFQEDEDPVPFTPARQLDDQNDLPAFPKQLEIQELIKSMTEKRSHNDAELPQ